MKLDEYVNTWESDVVRNLLMFMDGQKYFDFDILKVFDTMKDVYKVPVKIYGSNSHMYNQVQTIIEARNYVSHFGSANIGYKIRVLQEEK